MHYKNSQSKPQPDRTIERSLKSIAPQRRPQLSSSDINKNIDLNISMPKNIDQIDTEIERRVNLVKTHLISDLLSASGISLSANGVLNHITALLQLPVLIFLYKKSDADQKNALWIEHFNFLKMKESRGSLELRQANYAPIRKPSSVKLLNQKSEFLFRIYDTEFYIRIFLLDTDGNDETGIGNPFIEVKSSNPQYTNKASKKYKIQAQYINSCLSKLFSFNENDENSYGKEFLKIKFQNILNEILSQKLYSDVRGRRNVTLIHRQTEGDEIQYQHVQKAVSSYLSDAVGKNHGIDRIYNRSRTTSDALSWMGKSGQKKSDSKNTETQQNIIFSLRSYNRTIERCHNSNHSTNGYAHNVFLVIPNSQKDNLRKNLLDLIKIEKENNDICDELYGGGKKGTPKDWGFQDEAYRHLAKSLDQVFWEILNRKKGIDIILKKILPSPIGQDSVSFVDPVFYYGSAMYRMLFRRNGGLKRIHGLENILSTLSKEQRTTFSYDDILDKEIRRDCLRVVAFFYVTRFIGPEITSRGDFWTRILVVPLDVAGAVVGTVGIVSYELKKSEKVDILADAPNWTREFFFFTKIVTAAQYALRQHYRDFQIKRLCIRLRDELRLILYQAVATTNGKINETMILNTINCLNSEVIVISKVCPYPCIEFSLSPDDATLTQEGEGDFVDISIFRINFKTLPPKFSAFRSYTNQISKENSIENMQSLKTKLTETISLAFEEFHSKLADSYRIAKKLINNVR